MKTMKNKRIRIIVNIAIAVCVFGAWLGMFVRGGELLASVGVRSLRYFTVLSNLLEGIASIILAAALIRGKDSERLGVLKLVAATAVGLTFTVVMVFLGPLFGYPAMFRGANLWLHLIVPLAALAEFVLFNERDIPKKKCLWVASSPLVYGLFYLANILANGAPGNDFYGFTLWGMPVAFVIFALIIAGILLMGRMLTKANEKLRGSEETQ